MVAVYDPNSYSKDMEKLSGQEPATPGVYKEELDPSGLSPATPGAKLDAGKINAWLCLSGFAHALEEVARVTSFGARKYSPNGWQHVENGVERYMDAFGRHQFKLGQGERIDDESNCLHKAQLIWNLLASLELELRQEKKQG